jgi:hypothetical protein
MSDNPLMQSTVDEAGNRIDQYADGTEHVTFNDGSTTTTHPDGRRVQRARGETTITEPNGTTTFIPRPPDPARGELPYEQREWMPRQGPVHDDNSIHVWHADRVEVTHADGSIEIQHRDGRVVRHPAPPVQGPIQPGMPRTHTVTGTDGSVLRIEPDGRRTYTYRPGMAPDVLPQQHGQFAPPPPIVRDGGDGTTRILEADGTQRIVEDGVETVIPARPLRPEELERLRDSRVDPHRPGQAGADTQTFTVNRPGAPELLVSAASGDIEMVRDDGTQVRLQAPPPQAFGATEEGVRQRTQDATIGPDGSIIRKVDHVANRGDGERVLGTSTLVTRPDGSHVLTRPDGTGLVTSPDGTQVELPRGAQPPPPAGQPTPLDSNNKGCMKPAVLVVGAILVFLGTGAVVGSQLGGDDKEDVAAEVTTTTTQETTTTTEGTDDDSGGGATQVLVGEAAGLAEPGSTVVDPSAEVRASEVRIERTAAGDVFELHLQLFTDLDLGECFITCRPADANSGDELCAFIDVGPVPVTVPATVDVVITGGSCGASGSGETQTAPAQVAYTVGEDGVATGTLSLGGADVPFTAFP